MQTVTTEQALENAVASAEMEGYSFLSDEIENIQQCLDGKISYEDFLKSIIESVKRN